MRWARPGSLHPPPRVSAGPLPAHGGPTSGQLLSWFSDAAPPPYSASPGRSGTSPITACPLAFGIRHALPPTGGSGPQMGAGAISNHAVCSQGGDEGLCLHGARGMKGGPSQIPAPGHPPSPAAPFPPVASCSPRRGPVNRLPTLGFLPLCHLLRPRLVPCPSCCLSSEPPWIPPAGVGPACPQSPRSPRRMTLQGLSFLICARGMPVCVTPGCGWHSSRHSVKSGCGATVTPTLRWTQALGAPSDPKGPLLVNLLRK